MAISPKAATMIAEEKARLSPEELDQVDKIEEQIDTLVEQVYNGTSATVSIQRPQPKLVKELRLRYERVGWNFVTSAENREQSGFSITLTPKSA
jgi:hypothetical protein